MTALPSAVKSALAERYSEQDATISSLRVARGDLRLIEGIANEPADSRLGLVLSVDSTREFAEVLLVHTAAELASETDAVVPKSCSSAPYDVVVQTDLRAVVWTLQLRGAVGRTDEPTLRSIAAVTSSGEGDTAEHSENELGIYAGLRLAGHSDQRWSFKAAEGDALRMLAHDATLALLDRGMRWLVDPGLLRPDLVEHIDNRQELLQELLHWMATRSLELADSDLDQLVEAGVLNMEAWSSAGDLGLGLDVYTSVQEVLVNAATRGDPAGVLEAGRLTAVHLLEDDVNRKDERIHLIGLEHTHR